MFGVMFSEGNKSLLSSHDSCNTIIDLLYIYTRTYLCVLLDTYINIYLNVCIYVYLCIYVC